MSGYLFCFLSYLPHSGCFCLPPHVAKKVYSLRCCSSYRIVLFYSFYCFLNTKFCVGSNPETFSICYDVWTELKALIMLMEPFWGRFLKSQKGDQITNNNFVKRPNWSHCRHLSSRRGIIMEMYEENVHLDTKSAFRPLLCPSWRNVSGQELVLKVMIPLKILTINPSFSFHDERNFQVILKESWGDCMRSESRRKFWRKLAVSYWMWHLHKL